MFDLLANPRSMDKRIISIGIRLLAVFLVVGTAGPASAKNARVATRVEDFPSRPAGTPLLAIVSLRDQRVTIYDAEGKILRAPVSSGQPGFETPAGIYGIIQKEAEHYSNLYDDASMPFMQRLTWSGIALHAGALPGHPASHGCVRMPYSFAERLFGMTPLGMRVVVNRKDIAPVEISHPVLFQPLPSSDETVDASTSGEQPGHRSRLSSSQVPSAIGALQRIEALKALADKVKANVDAAVLAADAANLTARKLAADASRSTAALRLAEWTKSRGETQLIDAERVLATTDSQAMKELAEGSKAKALAKIAEAQKLIDAGPTASQVKVEVAARAAQEARTAEASNISALLAAREVTRRMKPISVFISRQTQRLYVRQAFEPVFDVPVIIKDSDKPIGTHVYMALGYTTNDAVPVRWSAVSMTVWGYTTVGRNREGQSQVVTGRAKAALDRIEIPREARDRISDVMAPGSSLIISDEEMSKETSKGTDFVILMSGEPQGSLKIRRREPSEDARLDRGYDRAYSRPWRRPHPALSWW